MKKDNFSIQEYVINVLNFMAQGLFASLIIGLILKQIGEKLDITWLMEFGKIAQLFWDPSVRLYSI